MPIKMRALYAKGYKYLFVEVWDWDTGDVFYSML